MSSLLCDNFKCFFRIVPPSLSIHSRSRTPLWSCCFGPFRMSIITIEQIQLFAFYNCLAICFRWDIGSWGYGTCPSVTC
jgi:hypothetical protein